MSVTVTDLALQDARYEMLGALAGYNHHEALGRMVRLWHWCTKKSSYEVTEGVVKAHLGPSGVDAILESELGERTESGIRVCGTKGRIEWYQKKVEAAKKGGKARAKGKRGADGRLESEGSEENPGQPQSNHPPATIQPPTSHGTSEKPAAATPSVSVSVNSPSGNIFSSEPHGPDPEPKPKSKPKYPEPPAEALALADQLAEHIRQRQPSRKELRLDIWPHTRAQWANAFRLANKQDGRTWDQLRAMVEKTQRDSFWQKNILSASKLRDKFDDLEMRLGAAKPAQGVDPQQAWRDRMAAAGLDPVIDHDWREKLAAFEARQ